MTPVPSNKKFGLLFSGIFFIFSMYAYLKHEAIAFIVILLLASAFFLISSLYCQELLGPINKAWFLLGVGLGKIVSPVVLSIIFFGIITPIAVIIKLNGRDELKLKRPKKSSYWIETNGSNFTESIKNQF